MKECSGGHEMRDRPPSRNSTVGGGGARGGGRVPGRLGGEQALGAARDLAARPAVVAAWEVRDGPAPGGGTGKGGREHPPLVSIERLYYLPYHRQFAATYLVTPRGEANSRCGQLGENSHLPGIWQRPPS